jgi:uncharacterized protein YgbK (DUF1537 family)
MTALAQSLCDEVSSTNRLEPVVLSGSCRDVTNAMVRDIAEKHRAPSVHAVGKSAIGRTLAKSCVAAFVGSGSSD